MHRGPGQVGGANDLIVLNVGGQTFITRKSTLYRVQHSRLYMVACGDYSAATGIIRLSPADIAGPGSGASAVAGAAGANGVVGQGTSGAATAGLVRLNRAQSSNATGASLEGSACCQCRCHYPGSMSLLASPESTGAGSVVVSPPFVSSPQGPWPGPAAAGGGLGAALGSNSSQTLGSRAPVPGPSHQSSARSTSLEEEAARSSVAAIPNSPAVSAVQQVPVQLGAGGSSSGPVATPTPGSWNISTNNLKLPNEIIYFDRDADIFRHVLDYYRNGELHLPQSACGPMARKELIFWGATIIRHTFFSHSFISVQKSSTVNQFILYSTTSN